MGTGWDVVAASALSSISASMGSTSTPLYRSCQPVDLGWPLLCWQLVPFGPACSSSLETAKQNIRAPGEQR